MRTTFFKKYFYFFISLFINKLYGKHIDIIRYFKV